MIFDEAGTYQIEYTATDDCGNETVAERTVIVEAPPTYRTVLYTDGTFIINESSRDEAANIQAHGQPTNIYDPFDPNGNTNLEKYIFNSASERPWNLETSSVISVKVGANISPTNTKHWFNAMGSCTSMDLSKLDTSLVTDMSNMFRNCSSLLSLDLSNFHTSAVNTMENMFNNCSSLTSLDISGFDTSEVTLATSMFNYCQSLTVLDLSSFDTSSITATNNMFNTCGALNTIYASVNFVVDHITNSTNMFKSCSNLVGGAGTTFSSSYIDKTRAKIDGGVSDPGYFTAKS